jgi:hypothetical protein
LVRPGEAARKAPSQLASRFLYDHLGQGGDWLCTLTLKVIDGYMGVQNMKNIALLVLMLLLFTASSGLTQVNQEETDS